VAPLESLQAYIAGLARRVPLLSCFLDRRRHHLVVPLVGVVFLRAAASLDPLA